MRKIILLLLFAGTAVTTKAQLFGRSYDEGYYYDNTGAKISGPIKGEETYIIFKKDKNDAAQKKILAADIKGYVLGTDSFTVSRNPGFKKPPFLKVLVDNPTKLYFFKAGEKIAFEPVPKGSAAASPSSFTIGKGKSHSKYYFYGISPDAVMLITPENFVSVMSDLMSDKPGIVALLKDKTFNIKNIEEWALFYNQERRPTLKIK